MTAYEILIDRGVTRLCHFTKFQSLTHILSSDYGVSSSSLIRQDMKNVTDKERYDGELNYVCCSVQYPNSWFLKKAMQNNRDSIFIDWVVMYIKPTILKYRNAKFCPCNASKNYGRYIEDNIDKIGMIFNENLSTFKYSRSRNMLSCCPTDGQAEILIEKNIPRDYIYAIAVGNMDMAGRVYGLLKLYGLENIDIYVAPKVLSNEWSEMARNGKKPLETFCDFSKEE